MQQWHHGLLWRQLLLLTSFYHTSDQPMYPQPQWPTAMRIRTGSVSREPSDIGRPYRTSLQAYMKYSVIPYHVCTTTGECRISGQRINQQSAIKNARNLWCFTKTYQQFGFCCRTLTKHIQPAHCTRNERCAINCCGNRHRHFFCQIQRTMVKSWRTGCLLALGALSTARYYYCLPVVPPLSVTPQ